MSSCLSLSSQMSHTIRRNIIPGIAVRVTQKHHQASGELTSGIVDRILTNSSNHHWGIKVRLVSGVVGRVKFIDSEANSNPVQRRTTLAELIEIPKNERHAWACKGVHF
jgi:uncharacterized repeat protein (TIGR03833 family)